jgi:hypothetical protein
MKHRHQKHYGYCDADDDEGRDREPPTSGGLKHHHGNWHEDGHHNKGDEQVDPGAGSTDLVWNIAAQLPPDQ